MPHARVQAVGSQQLIVSPVLDDAFAREVGDFDSVDALREAVRKDLTAHVAREREAEVRTQLLDQIIEANPFDVPPSWVRQLSSPWKRRPFVTTVTEQAQFCSVEAKPTRCGSHPSATTWRSRAS